MWKANAMGAPEGQPVGAPIVEIGGPARLALPVSRHGPLLPLGVTVFDSTDFRCLVTPVGPFDCYVL